MPSNRDRETTIAFARNCLDSGVSADAVLRLVFDGGVYQGMQDTLSAMEGVVRRHEVEAATERELNGVVLPKDGH